MISDLPSPLLRSFVAVVECGSLASAAARMGRSESALSLQMARLEDVIGRRLFDRDGRSLKLNASGSAVLGHARSILNRIDAARMALDTAAMMEPVRVGVVQDFVGPVLGPALQAFKADHPVTRFDVLVDGSAELLKAMGESRIDIVLCAGGIADKGPACTLQMEWFGSAEILQQEVLPLVSVSPPCPFLRAACEGLDAAGMAYRLAVVTPSLDGVRAALQAGLGLACRTTEGMGLPRLAHGGRLPQLPTIRYSLTERHGAGNLTRQFAKALGQQIDVVIASDPGNEKPPA
jgi:DNA-binding transcriptional LysR family regulator